MDTQRLRRIGKWVTLSLSGAVMVCALPYLYLMIQHARVDSEVGVMMYGLPVAIGATLASPLVAAFAACWGLGLYRLHGEEGEVPLWELILCVFVGGATGYMALSFLYRLVFGM